MSFSQHQQKLHVLGVVGVLLDNRRELGSRPGGEAVGRVHGNATVSVVLFAVSVRRLGVVRSGLVGRQGKSEPRGVECSVSLFLFCGIQSREECVCVCVVCASEGRFV